MNGRETIVVIGGGFAGINFIKKIDRSKYDVILIDRNNFHSFPPLFYQVASSGLEPASISFPFRREIRKMKQRPRFHMGDVKKINIDEKSVTTQFETLHYDKLVIAAGTTNNYFNLADLYKYVFTLKSTVEAIRCRNEILDRLERASNASSPEVRKRLLSFAVVGGGPTGVEIAGAIGEMKRYILHREYPAIHPDELSITLIEGSDRLLRTMSETASKSAVDNLESLFVDIHLQKTMQSYSDNIITFTDGSTLYAEMLIWTAGITGVSFEMTGKSLPTGPGNRIIVDEFNRVEGIDDVYAIGDLSLHTDNFYPHGCPQLAQVAIQQAHTLARNLNDGNFSHPFKYHDKGSMATIGRNRAVADLKHTHLTGFPAWFSWMFVHLVSLLGMRNKLVVLTNWIWAYFSYPTSLRLLFHPSRYPLRSRWGER